MDNTQLNRLLNTACEIITSLESYADDELKQEIEAMFFEILSSDELDDEIKINYSDNLDADMEAQDWETFKENKI